jgi:tRNA dimethylallyltransferase
VIGGPTATGKTGLAIRLAEGLLVEGVPAEVIGADSRQVYRGLDIGTAKVTPAEQGRIAHHCIDLVDPDVRFSVADFVDHAGRALAGITARGGLALLVGGTGLYLRAVARGMATDALPHDPAVRAALEAELADRGLAPLVTRLEELAPARATATDRSNPRRVVRALEVATLQGDAPLPPARGYGAPVLWLGLDLPDRDLHRRWIARRARSQFEAGLIEEAAALRRSWDPTLPCFSAIGYREAWSVLDGEASIEEAIEADAWRNVAFARRQRTWFRSEPEVQWIDASDDPLPEVRDRIGSFLRDAGYPDRS